MARLAVSDLPFWRVEELADHRGQPIGAVDEADVGGAGEDREPGVRQTAQVAEARLSFVLIREIEAQPAVRPDREEHELR
jgi:hypothetical protein